MRGHLQAADGKLSSIILQLVARPAFPDLWAVLGMG